MVDQQVINRWRLAPRLNAFTEFFERTASGLEGAPDFGAPLHDPALLSHDVDCLSFADTHRRLWGKFENHYFASIPYRLEEECRLGAAIFRFCLKSWAKSNRPATFYTLGAGAGSLTRSLAKLGDGRVKTLNCSPTDGNRVCFFEKRGSHHAHFFHGPFFELTSERYAADKRLTHFREGYDVLLEDTTFQMYGSDRINQNQFVAQTIKPDGLLIQVQKLLHRDAATYVERERQKDDHFKSRFFSDKQIAEKKRDVLNKMIDFQVDQATSVSALKPYFRYSVITWNSGNFYTIVSSNARTSITDFISSLVKPAIPAAYNYEQLPMVIVEDVDDPLPEELLWRSAVSAAASMIN
ncbi:class I SAM-dependent methyltransferase [Agrobacterium sp.]|uniref:class I SAM-dependent methyltransferase n=1 Tax=Agrobacterium sp. TaxID=361 RepID=UPI0028B1A59E